MADKAERYASYVICAAGAAAGGYLIIKYALPVALPFIIAWGIGSAVSPAADYISRHTSIPRRVSGGFVAVFLFILLVVGLFISGEALISELAGLVKGLPPIVGMAEDMLSELTERVVGFLSSLPVIGEIIGSEENGEMRQMLRNAISGALGSLASSISGRLPAFLTKAVSAIPTVMLTLGVTAVAGFCFSIGGGEQVAELLPKGVREKARQVVSHTAKAFRGWARAYLLIMVMTFCELLVGFLFLRVKYAFLIALVTAAIDILPLFGAGTVLIPWAVISLMQKNFGLGTGLIILWGVITVIRQLAEPRIVGSSLGLPTLVSLAAMFIGFRIAGIVGMVAFPALASLIFAFIGCDKEGRTDHLSR